MTMFRRVFSNHFDGQPKEQAAPPAPKPAAEIPPGPPDLPPQLALPTKSALTELSQVKRNGPVLDPHQVDAPPAVDPDLAERAAEIHAQMLQRSTRPEAATSVAPSITPPAPALAEFSEATAQPAPAAEPAPTARRPGRARTRLLGFDGGADLAADPIAQAQSTPQSDTRTKPAGWLVLTKGPGLGHHFALFSGVAMVGRGEDQAIRLDFGDQAISRQNHAAIAYDPEDNKFYLGHGGKSNIIKLNGRPVLSTEEIHHGDTIRIGETTLRLVALCGADFQWGRADDV